MQDEVRFSHHLTDVPAPRSCCRRAASRASPGVKRGGLQSVAPTSPPSPAALPVLPGLLNALLFCPTTQQSWRIVGRALTHFPDFERLPFGPASIELSLPASTRLRFQPAVSLQSTAFSPAISSSARQPLRQHFGAQGPSPAIFTTDGRKAYFISHVSPHQSLFTTYVVVSTILRTWENGVN